LDRLLEVLMEPVGGRRDAGQRRPYGATKVQKRHNPLIVARTVGLELALESHNGLLNERC
jgi:hypothetical protein